MSNPIYAAWFRGHELHSEDESCLVGIYTGFTLALEPLRSMRMHNDDEWSIRQHFLNQIGPGETIWSSGADDGSNEKSCYLRFWPAEFPSSKTKDP